MRQERKRRNKVGLTLIGFADNCTNHKSATKHCLPNNSLSSTPTSNCRSLNTSLPYFHHIIVCVVRQAAFQPSLLHRTAFCYWISLPESPPHHRRVQHLTRLPHIVRCCHVPQQHARPTNGLLYNTESLLVLPQGALLRSARDLTSANRGGRPSQRRM